MAAMASHGTSKFSSISSKVSPKTLPHLWPGSCDREWFCAKKMEDIDGILIVHGDIDSYIMGILIVHGDIDSSWEYHGNIMDIYWIFRANLLGLVGFIGNVTTYNSWVCWSNLYLGVSTRKLLNGNILGLYWWWYWWVNYAIDIVHNINTYHYTL